MLDPDMPAQELRLHMGEMTAQEMRTARAAIRWANSKARESVRSAESERDNWKEMVSAQFPTGDELRLQKIVQRGGRYLR